MDTVEFVRPFDATPDCASFELQDEGRVFLFQAPGHAEMLYWILIIEKVMNECKDRRLKEQKAKIAAETPELVRLYDALGEAPFLETVEKTLSELYPTMECAEMTIREQIECASAVVNYLQEVVHDVQSVGPNKIARY